MSSADGGWPQWAPSGDALLYVEYGDMVWHTVDLGSASDPRRVSDEVVIDNAEDDIQRRLDGRASRFLERFASSFRTHALEQLLRLTAGLAFIGFSSEMRFPGAFQAFGWVLVVSAVLLLLLPWRLHRRLAGLVIPPLTRHLTTFGLAALLLGAMILYAMF